jgi:hypothetical protein
MNPEGSAATTLHTTHAWDVTAMTVVNLPQLSTTQFTHINGTLMSGLYTSHPAHTHRQGSIGSLSDTGTDLVLARELMNVLLSRGAFKTACTQHHSAAHESNCSNVVRTHVPNRKPQHALMCRTVDHPHCTSLDPESVSEAADQQLMSGCRSWGAYIAHVKPPHVQATDRRAQLSQKGSARPEYPDNQQLINGCRSRGA